MTNVFTGDAETWCRHSMSDYAYDIDAVQNAYDVPPT
jgi:hypothetical protein